MRIGGKGFVFIILLAIAGTVFYLGWVQFKVRPDSCGVLVSKTGGIWDVPVTSGKFVWKWEPVLPTNADVRVFSLTPYKAVKAVDGTLPSADIYSQIIKEDTAFSYSMRFNVCLRYHPDGFVNLVKKTDAKTDADVTAELDKTAVLVSQRAAAWILSKAAADEDFSASSVSSSELQKAVKSAEDFPDIEFTDFSIASCSLPDMVLYGKARKSIEQYTKKVDAELSALVLKEAVAVSESDVEMRRLSKLGEVLRKYPELADVLKGGDITATLKAVKSLQQ